MYRINNKQHLHLAPFFEKDVSESLFLFSRRFSIAIQTTLILLLGFALFVPYTQIISGFILYSLIFIPESWKSLPYEGKERVKKGTALFLLTFSNLVLNADTIFFIALSAYMSDKALVLATLSVGALCTLLHEFTLRKQLLSKTHYEFSFFKTTLARKFFRFCYIGMMAFQAGFLVVSDTYFLSHFPLTMTDRTIIGFIVEAGTYALLGLYFFVKYLFRKYN